MKKPQIDTNTYGETWGTTPFVMERWTKPALPRLATNLARSRAVEPETKSPNLAVLRRQKKKKTGLLLLLLAPVPFF